MNFDIRPSTEFESRLSACLFEDVVTEEAGLTQPNNTFSLNRSLITTGVLIRLFSHTIYLYRENTFLCDEYKAR